MGLQLYQGGKESFASDNMTRSFLQRYGAYCSSVELSVDARGLRWPQGPKGHSGEHEQAVDIVCKHKKFKNWLSDVKETFLMLSDSEQIVIAVVCKSGINKSVTCGRILAEIFSLEGVAISLCHLEKNMWQQRGLCTAPGRS